MSSFYTNVKQWGNQLLVRAVEDGQRVSRKINYEPYLFVQTNKGQGGYMSVYGEPVEKKDFDTIKEAKNFIEEYKDVAGFRVYGMNEFTYPFINDIWPGEVEYDLDKIVISSMDIETMSDDGFPNVLEADKEITVITMKDGENYVVICVGDYTPHQDNVILYRCDNEVDLLRRFLMEVERIDPDVWTGWNIEFFDIPYLFNRLTRILGDKQAKRMSPWGIAREKWVATGYGREQQTYELAGVAVLDYLSVYKKFVLDPRESYKLDHIGEVELGVKKIDYSEYGSLHDLYVQNFQKYVEYNVRDTELIDWLEDKLKLLELALAIAYDAKINFVDALTSVKMWDVIIHNYLMDRNIVIPQKKRVESHAIVGGFVKESAADFHNWVVSFDLNSLYPHLIMQYNISPEKFRGKLPEEQSMSVEMALRGHMADEEIVEIMKEKNVAMTPNGCMWSRDERGFLPALMDKMYKDRKVFKKKMLEEKTKYEETKDEKHKSASVRYDKVQHAKKIQLNSAYGALGNQYFRWFNPDHAESITTGGQLSIRWIEKELNQYLNKLLKTENYDYVIAADTDSVYLELDNLVKKQFRDREDRSTEEVVDWLDDACEKAFEKFIDKAYARLAEYVNAYEQKMQMKREAIADKGIWTGKKHYILNVYDNEGVRYKEPDLKMMGIEAVKSSTPAICRDAIKDCLKIIMRGTEEELQEYIEQFRRTFKQQPFEKVAFPRGLNNVDKFTDPVAGWKSGTPIQVRGAIVYNLMIKHKGYERKLETLKDGDKIRFSYLKTPNPARSNVITAPDGLPKEFLELEHYIDYDTQFEKAFLKPLRAITEVMQWNQEHVSTLEDFFA